eukprot:CAMPEP_0196599108 /NCGR_PEP_ID=MMETSP1081-20130531/94685_1 /TAXON_ID=36882 /ORGANISM="Pyramimonas amylifera, Strain CCMP720" /LENGTH=122 /DNA_ID=CAMNT_0041924863 /DNA_START=231 /DNA_END=599 /DNA_ORIENTATION=-
MKREKAGRTLKWSSRLMEEPNWEDPETNVLAFTLRSAGSTQGLATESLNASTKVTGRGVFVAFNCGGEPANVALPVPPVGTTTWWKITDSAMAPPFDNMEVECPSGIPCYAAPYSSVVMEAR